MGLEMKILRPSLKMRCINFEPPLPFILTKNTDLIA